MVFKSEKIWVFHRISRYLAKVVNVENSNVFVNFQIENITINLFENIVIKSFVVFKTILTLVLSGL